MIIKIIGDVCGEVEEYLRIIMKDGSKIRHSIQLGDFGLYLYGIRNVNPLLHKILAGNEDNFNNLTAHYLGDFGTIWKDIFYIRGGHQQNSTDSSPCEQLSITDLERCFVKFKEEKPPVVVSHSAPGFISEAIDRSFICRKSRTEQYLDKMLLYHRPKVWFFSHPRKSFRKKLHDTDWIGLAPLEVVNLYIDEPIPANFKENLKNEVQKECNA